MPLNHKKVRFSEVKGKKSWLLAGIAVALAFASCSGLKEIEFFTPEEMAEMFARWASSSSSEISSNSEGSSSSGESSSSSSAPILLQCGVLTYDQNTHFCLNNTPTLLCGGNQYKAYQFCDYDEVYDKCNNAEYNTTAYICCNNQQKDIYTYKCCRNTEYVFDTHYCHSDGKTYTCGGKPLDPSRESCIGGEIVAKCGGITEYDPETELCCGSSKYEYSSHFCVWSDPPEIVKLCNGKEYDIETQFCHTDGEIYSKCGGQDYDPATHYCHTDGNAYSCGNLPLNPATQFCYNSSKVGDYCGDNPQKYYDPGLYQCKPSVNSNGIFLKNPVPYEGENYEAVLLGEQVWMARNLNYAKTGSKCGNGSSLSDGNTTTCNTYGRLYNWATAMAVCPSGWHLPSNAEWTTLALFVGGTGTYGDNGTAGTKLKAKSGWNTGSGYIPGTDFYGFSALPGGYGDSGDDFINVGRYGRWWINSQGDSPGAFYRSMGYINEVVGYYYYDKIGLFSVRCVKD